MKCSWRIVLCERPLLAESRSPGGRNSVYIQTPLRVCEVQLTPRISGRFARAASGATRPHFSRVTMNKVIRATLHQQIFAFCISVVGDSMLA